MTKIFKISLFISLLAIVFTIGNFVFAQGYGYFTENERGFFIFDKLYIDGYFSVEANEGNNMVTGNPGDVLVSSRFLLDENSNFYFCEDERGANPNIPINKDCDKKMMIWKPDKLIVTSDMYQLITNKISAPNGFINFEIGDLVDDNDKEVYTGNNVEIKKCFSNFSEADCGDEEDVLKTDRLKVGSLLSRDKTKVSQIGSGIIDYPMLTLDVCNAYIPSIDLGSEENIDNQYICWKGVLGTTCAGGAFGGTNSKWNYNIGGINSAGNFNGGAKLCCQLKLTF